MGICGLDFGTSNSTVGVIKGGAKNPFAGMDGTFKNVSTEDAYAIAQRELNNPDSE